jgi:hypothetical protein
MRGSYLIFLALAIGCAPSMPTDFAPASPPLYEGANEPAARFVFHRDHFTDLEDFITHRNTRFNCLGDVLHTFKVNGGDFTTPASLSSFSISDSGDELLPTHRPAFIKNLSVDMTNTFYKETQAYSVQTDACSKRALAESSGPLSYANGDPSPCADFDWSSAGGQPAPLPTIAPPAVPDPTPVPPMTPAYLQGLNYYRVRDPWCAYQGHIRNGAVDPTKSYIGGVNIDLDRQALGRGEDLLMLMTYQAFAPGESWPYPATQAMSEADQTRIEIDLIGTGFALDQLLTASQPRAWEDYQNVSQPVYLKTLATLNDPFSQLKTDQVLIPLSENALIDRIRVSRVRGSFHLYQIDLYRLGPRGL